MSLIEKTEQINIKITKLEKEKIEQQAKKYKFASVSEFLRFVALNSNIIVESKNV